MIQIALWIAVTLLILIAIIEIWFPSVINEGFESLVPIGDSPFWSKWMPRRGDVSFDPHNEEKGYIRDIRYFQGYADIQRLGVKHDFCRMVEPKDAPGNLFFTCALGGTEGLSTVKFRTNDVRHGFQTCRDDYMTELDNQAAYCRIIKTGTSTFETKCNVAGDIKFRDKLTLDTNPPPEIARLLMFYEGLLFWLRLRDDMLDYAKNIHVAKAGGITIEENPPNPPKTDGLEFNGVDQFLRIGDGKELDFGNVISLQYMRAISFWVYFEEFTNNAHILDFGNGAGQDNVWVGILGRGNSATQTKPHRIGCGDNPSTVPSPPSGAQPVDVVTPQTLMETTAANVNDFQCQKPEIYGRVFPPEKAPKPHEAKTADLIYEIWDHEQRKMHIQVKDVIPLRKWTHITITATSQDAFRPGINIYQNGNLVHTEEAGWLPQTNFTSSNYIGKSNWANVTSPYENADELFKGNLFDLRAYTLPMSDKKIQATVEWGKEMLGLTPRQEN